jgi:hypothetical protein
VRHKKLLVPALAGVLAVFGLSASGADAMADNGTAGTQLTGFHQMAVDGVGGNSYIFLSGSDSGSDGIVVTDLSGNAITTLDTGDVVEGLALSADGSTLYAAVASGTDAGNVAVITVSSITPTTTTPSQTLDALGAGDIPYSLAIQSGSLWVSYTDSSGQAGIGSFDSGTGTFAPAPTDNWSSAPDLAADPQGSGTLVAVQPGTALVGTYTTANGTLSPIAQAATTLGQCSNETQLAVVPGGADFIAACGTSVNEYSVSGLAAPQSSYAAGSAAPAGTAIDADGTVAVGSSAGIYVYGSGGTPENVFHLGSSASLAAGGLAWEDAGTPGSQLVAVVDSGGTYSVQVFAAKVSLSGPAQADVTKTVTLTGAVTLPGGTVPAGTEIAITRTLSGTTTSLPPVTTVGANGSFTLTDTPAAVGTYTYTAKYANTGTIPPAIGTYKLSVVRMAPALAITTGATTFNYDSTVHVTAHLGTTYTNRAVSVYAQWDGYRAKTRLTTGRVNSSGELTVSYTAPRSTTFSVVFAGDAHYAAETVSRDVGVRAATTMSISGYNGTRGIGGTAYRLYHLSSSIYLSVAVQPGKPGECVRIEIQEHYNGAWRANGMTGCSALDASSNLYGTLSVGGGDRGYQYRIRADYVRSARDITNLSSDSGWQYVVPER